MLEIPIEILSKKNCKVYEVKINKTLYLVLNDKDEWTILEQKELFLDTLPKYETQYKDNYIVKKIIDFIKEKKYEVDRVCSWCGKKVGTKLSTNKGTTHTICPECRAKEEAKLDGNK